MGGDDPVVPPARSPRSGSTRRMLLTTGAARYQHRTPTPMADSASRILRPRRSRRPRRGHLPRPCPKPTNGQITYDVDNDGDGMTDSVWVDLGYPARRNSAGPPLQAAVRLHGHRLEWPHPAQHGRQPAPAPEDPCPAPGQLGQRDRPDLWPPECLRLYDYDAP